MFVYPTPWIVLHKLLFVMESLEKALVLKEELDSLRPIGREQELRIMQKFRLDWNYHSNNLEGNSLTYGETKALILFGITAQGKPLKDHIEIGGHNEAVEWVMDVVKGEYPLTENFIRELHTLLLKEPYTVNAITPDGLPTQKRVEVGKYKSQPNHVLTNIGEIFRFASPEETPALMHDLLSWYQEKIALENVNVILLAAEFHYRFIRIHPFDDGNGRTARILMNFILMQYNFPPVIIKTEEKAKYFAALRQADSGIFEPFLNLIADYLVDSLELMIKGAKGESIEEASDFDKELALLELKLSKTKQETVKTAELITTLYDNSIVPLFYKFVEEGKKFERFYVKSSYHLKLDRLDYVSDNLIEAIPNIRTRITSDTIEIAMSYYYKMFRHSEYGDFNFNNVIEVIFNNRFYTIKCDSKAVLEKNYHDHLTEAEINDIVKQEMIRHKSYIESKIAGK